MPRREIKWPQWDVHRENENVIIEVVAPGSKFGAVEIWLTSDEAQQLGIALLPLVPSSAGETPDG